MLYSYCVIGRCYPSDGCIESSGIWPIFCFDPQVTVQLVTHYLLTDLQDPARKANARWEPSCSGVWRTCANGSDHTAGSVQATL